MHWLIYKKPKKEPSDLTSELVEEDIYYKYPCKCNVDDSKGQKNLFNYVLFSSTGYIDKTEVVKAELLFAGFFIGHNLPLATADHVGIFLQSILWS